MTDKAPVDPVTSRARIIAQRVAEMRIREKLQEIEEAVERKCEERRNGNGHA